MGAPAQAADPQNQIQVSANEEAQLRNFLTKFDVEPSTQDRLIKDFKSGAKWQSLASSSEPVSTSTMVEDGVTWNVDRFADGSVRATGIGGSGSLVVSRIEGVGEVTPMGVNDCGYAVGKTGNFSNCNIYYWVGVVTSNFKANFTVNASGYDKITLAWGSTFTAIGSCSTTVPSPKIVKGTESSTGPAAAGFTARAQMCGYPYGTSFPSYLYVGGNKARHEYS